MLKEYQKEALLLAKRSIYEEFWKDNLQDYTPVNKKLLEEKACFVTLKTENINLRWCIGSIYPTWKLYLDIIKNAKLAAFSDPRFNPIEFDELDNLYVEISVLSTIQQKKFNNIDLFLKYLKENKPGLIIKLWYNSATFLPSVWKELPDENQFLAHLVAKANISWNMFVENFDKVETFFYQSEEFGDWWKNI